MVTSVKYENSIVLIILFVNLILYIVYQRSICINKFKIVIFSSVEQCIVIVRNCVSPTDCRYRHQDNTLRNIKCVMKVYVCVYTKIMFTIRIIKNNNSYVLLDFFIKNTVIFWLNGVLLNEGLEDGDDTHHLCFLLMFRKVVYDCSLNHLKV